MTITRRGWRSRDARLNPSGGVDVENMGVVEVRETRLLAFVVVAAKDD